MEKEIQELEEKLAALKSAFNLAQKKAYEAKPHKDFKIGDLVTNGRNMGTVAWTENKNCGYPESDGYMGIDLISGTRGFSAPARRDEYELVTDPYFKEFHDIHISLTGLEIEELKYSLGPSNANPNPVKTAVIRILDSFLFKNDNGKTNLHPDGLPGVQTGEIRNIFDRQGHI